ncbi:hypothetical protein Hanom_Chr03g00251101 [Helianthus anomalus]
MHHVVALIAERQKDKCTNRSLSRLLSIMVSLKADSLFLRGRGKTFYTLPSSDPTFALLLLCGGSDDDDLVVYLDLPFDYSRVHVTPQKY